MISVYNDTEPAPARATWLASSATRGRIEGFLVGDHYDLQPRVRPRMAATGSATGELQYRETFVDGIENTLDAFLGVLRGENTGKMVVKL